MRLVLLSLSLLLTACNSSDQTTDPQSTDPIDGSPGDITIADDSREPLPAIPAINFNGVFETTANPDAGEGTALDSSSPTSSFDGSGGADGSTDGTTDGSTDGGDADGGTDGATSVEDSLTFPGPGPNPVGPIEPGTLTAGSYNDHLNPHLYQHYAGDYLQQRGQWIDVPRMDFNQRIRIEVTDASGTPMPDANIEIQSDTGQSVVTLQTPADGVASLYTDLDGLPEAFRLRVTGPGGTTIQSDINLQQAGDAGSIQVTLQEQAPSQAPVDLMFVVDTTGSMGDELSFLQTELSDIINSITLQQSTIQIGFVFYRDYGDAYVVRTHGFSGDLNTIQSTLNQQSANGGGDYPEAMDQALHAAVDAGWRSTSRKVIFLIADAPPHGDRMRATWEAAEQARTQNIHIVPVAASGVAEDAEYIMRSAAALTNGRYLFLTDDSGLGLPHAEPDIECYVVTTLRLAMTNALNSLATGTNVEPTANDIIREVGDYNNGVCGQNTDDDPQPTDSQVLIDRQSAPNGGFTEKQTRVITDQSSLNDALASYGEDQQTVDFSTGQVLLIDRGQQTTGGYSITPPVFSQANGQLQADIVFTDPGINCAVTLALTNPYMFVYVPSRLDILISERSETRDCSS